MTFHRAEEGPFHLPLRLLRSVPPFFDGVGIGGFVWGALVDFFLGLRRTIAGGAAVGVWCIIPEDHRAVGLLYDGLVATTAAMVPVIPLAGTEHVTERRRRRCPEHLQIAPPLVRRSAVVHHHPPARTRCSALNEPRTSTVAGTQSQSEAQTPHAERPEARAGSQQPLEVHVERFVEKGEARIQFDAITIRIRAEGGGCEGGDRVLAVR
mmetsp:Transcript_30596/g.73875  ORF Transcript_30596/g.73875 Transcript_30596/m.73875 type:complete len:209 (+) Transcript_30596:543-1169(+)